ncbi:MAG: pyridoxal phosphate-dependent aminotransferase [Candidatus Lernaella stagnicola]|nr:pyridoxal phosphate-dependent aminotransferase [Candidatus Lernaella stagnicola]
MIKASERSNNLPPFLVMEVLEKAQQMEAAGEHVIHMEVGEPDFDSPACVIDAAVHGLRHGQTHYTHSMGRRDLREAIGRWHGSQYGSEVDPDTVIVTVGSSPALLLVFAALCDPGDEVILSNPGYACYPQIVGFGGGTCVFVDVFEADGFQYRPEAIAAKITPRTKAILVNSPSNPTGNLIGRERLTDICSLGPVVVSDEIYHGLVYEGRAVSAREITKRSIVVGGFSKLFAMTGWRLGYLIVPPELVRPVQKMQQNFFISAGDFIQTAAIAALEGCGADVERMRLEYDRRRRMVLAQCAQIGLGVTVEPTGAFYVFINVARFSQKLEMDSYALAFDILEKAKVAVTPGTDFGSGGEGYLRLSYANSYENLVEGMRRLAEYFAGVD